MRERHSTPRRTVTGVLAASAMVLALAACGDDEDAAPAATEAPAAEATATAEAEAGGGIAVADAWSRQPAEGQAVTAVYGIVTNDTDADVTIVAASTSVTDNVELHETLMGDDGTMKMQEKEGGFVVPAGGEFVFESGGPHVMLFDIDPATYPDSVDVTLELDNGETVAFTAEVRAIDSTEMSGMEMSGDDMHGSEESGDHAAGEEDHSGPAESLHDVDEQLQAGMLDAENQLSVVRAEIEKLVMEGEPADGTPEAEYHQVLLDLEAAIEAGDVEAAAPLATMAHDMGHELEEHGG